MRFSLSSLTLLLGLIFTLTACENEQEPNFQFGGGGTIHQTLSKGDVGRLEMPRLTGENTELFITHKTAPVTAGGDSILNYAYAYDTRYFHSKWVAFRFDNITSKSVVSRKPNTSRPLYPRDPKLPFAYALRDDISFNKGNDHGHLCASADRLYSREANDQTFYLSNMSPQKSDFNQNYWTAFESKVRDFVKLADTLYVVKGGTLNNPDGFQGFVADNKMPVPSHYYMAVLRVKNGNFTAIGFLIEHKNYGITANNTHVRQHAVSIRDLEAAAGIDFFHNLPDVVENAVESSYNLSAWGL